MHAPHARAKHEIMPATSTLGGRCELVASMTNDVYNGNVECAWWWFCMDCGDIAHELEPKQTQPARRRQFSCSSARVCIFCIFTPPKSIYTKYIHNVVQMIFSCSQNTRRTFDLSINRPVGGFRIASNRQHKAAVQVRTRHRARDSER